MHVERWQLDSLYSLDDLADMHEVLDELEEYGRRADAKAKADAAKPKGKR